MSQCPIISKWFPQFQYNRAPSGCGGKGDSLHGCREDKSTLTARWVPNTALARHNNPHSLGLVHLWEEIRQCVGRAPYRKAPGRSEPDSCGSKYSVLFRSDCKMSSSLVFKFRFFLEIIQQVLSIGRVMSLRIYGCSSVFHAYAREDFACLQLKITSWS